MEVADIRIKNKDRYGFEAMCRTGYVRREHLNSLRIADSRINQYRKEGYIVKEVQRGQEGFKLTKKGHDLARELGIENHYKLQSFNHDIAIADKYFSLNYEERASFLTEGELRDKFKEHIEDLRGIDSQRAKELERKLDQGKISTPDCSYVSSNGETVAFEVITANYKTQHIQAKQEFVKEMNMGYEEVRR